MARCGVASRRACDDLIAAGRVRVNGVVAAPGARVDSSRDSVELDGRPLRPAPIRTLVLHKPPGVTSSRRDRHADRCVIDLVPRESGALFPVGRLDRDTEGVLILTNDGALAHVLAHPSYEVERVYRAEVEGTPSAAELGRLLEGVPCEGETLVADRVRLLGDRLGADGTAGGPDRAGGSVVEVVLHQGRKREVRRMLRRIGHPVVRLVRTRFGPVSLGDLPRGACRELTGAEREALQALLRRSGLDADV